MPRATKKTNSTKAKECELTVKPSVLEENLKLLYAAVNIGSLDRLNIEVGNSKSIFYVGGDVCIKISHKAAKSLRHPLVQVSCKQLRDYALKLDKSPHKLRLAAEEITLSNQKQSYQYSLCSYQDVIPQNEAEFTPCAKVNIKEFQAALKIVADFTDTDAKNVTSGVHFQIKPQLDPDAETNDHSLIVTLTGVSNSALAQTVMSATAIDSDSIGAFEPVEFVLSKKVLSLIASYAKDFVIAIDDETRSVQFSWGSTSQVVCSTQTLKGSYPNLDEVKSQMEHNDVEIELNTQELISALKRHQVSSKEVNLIIEETQCTVSQNNDVGSGSENLFCHNPTENKIELWLFVDYFLKVLDLIKEKTVKLKLCLETDQGDDDAASNHVLIQEQSNFFCLAQLVETND
ncbi:MAG: hypothetical protein AAFQ80_07860 [Cyanobacteria bacterium J06621_8]